MAIDADEALAQALADGIAAAVAMCEAAFKPVYEQLLQLQKLQAESVAALEAYFAKV